MCVCDGLLFLFVFSELVSLCVCDVFMLFVSRYIDMFLEIAIMFVAGTLPVLPWLISGR